MGFKKFLRVYIAAVFAAAFVCLPAIAWADVQDEGPADQEELVYEEAQQGVFSESADGQDALLQDAGLAAEPEQAQAETEASAAGLQDTPDDVAEADDSEADALLVADVAESSGVLLMSEQADNAEAVGEDAPPNEDELQDSGVPMHRMYNPNSGEHFYTASEYERDYLSEIGWNYEGVGWVAPSTGDAVFRLYNPNVGDHHYTLSEFERDYLASVGWNYEGIGWFSGGECAVLRQYNPNAKAGAHNFTTSQEENDHLARVGWNAEGVGWYALADSADSLISQRSSVCATISAEGKDMRIEATFADSMYYLLLPSFTNLKALRLSALFAGKELPIAVTDWNSTEFKDIALGESVNVESLSTVSADNGARLMFYKISGSSAVQKLGVMISSAISSIHLESVNEDEGRAYVEASANHSAKADVLVTVVDSKGRLVYDKDSADKASTIKGRGNSTWANGNKKPYQIKLNKKADLLVTGDSANEAKKWLLIANAADPSLVRNLFAYNLGLELGMTGTQCTPIDLYYDGEYRGNYLLCEKIEVGKGRVDIFDLEDAVEDANEGVDLEGLPRATATNSYGLTFQYAEGVADPNDLSGGYVLELDSGYYASEVSWFESSFGQVVVKSPEFCSYNMMKYISEYFEAAVRNLYANDANPADGYSFDIDSFANTYLASEMTKEIDTFVSSTYFYLDRPAVNPLIYAAPLWDFDTIASRNELPQFYYYHGFLRPESGIQAASNALLQTAAKDIWTVVLSPLMKNVAFGDVSAVGTNGFLHSFAYYRDLIAASQQMNEVAFGITTFGFQIDAFDSYDRNFDYLVDWLKWRVAWLDDNIDRLSGTVRNTSTVHGGVDYGLVFDASYYKKLLGETSISDTLALSHFVQVGMLKGDVASRNFNVFAYKDRYEDLCAIYGDDLVRYYQHYIERGFKEGRVAI